MSILLPIPWLQTEVDKSYKLLNALFILLGRKYTEVEQVGKTDL